MSNLSCHIIGLNPYSKKEFILLLNDKIFNHIDLDNINQEILHDPILDKMYKQYEKLKNDKNDKFKEIDKKMSEFWQNKFIEIVESKINNKKMNVLIGQNNHYKNITKKIPIECTNKFIIKSNYDDEAKQWIRYNLENHKDEIINGKFPLEYINFEFIKKKKENIENSYKKIGYTEKTLEQLKTIINLIELGYQKGGSIEIWVSLKDEYNINSLIHPITNNKIYGYKDPNIALLSSFNIPYEFTGKEVLLKDKDNIEKLSTKRYLYLVDNKHFIPNDNGLMKYFSQLPVKILAKEKINNVLEYIK